LSEEVAMNTALTDAASTSEPIRRRRARAAALLAAASNRARLGWPELAALPDWAMLPRERLEAFARTTGAWAHAGSLRRCIDGRVLQQLRERIGEPALRALLAAPDIEGETMALLDASSLTAAELDRLLPCTGRDWLLASVESPALRDALRECLWPGAGPSLRAIHGETAAVTVRAAEAGFFDKESE